MGGFGLYIHWPFCESKCPYCDFNSHVSRTVDQNQWLSAYLTEIDRIKSLTGNRVLNTVFFGGGTPSLMDPEIVHKILDHVHKTWPCANEMEITLEANPSSVEARRFQGYAQAGVNRISMGIQALNDTDLRRLGRIHTHQEARNAFDIARSVFDRVSFDLIYARPAQTLDEWARELDRAIDLAADHLSLYQLTIEQGTPFFDLHKRGKIRVPEAREKKLFFFLQKCDQNPLPQRPFFCGKLAKIIEEKIKIGAERRIKIWSVWASLSSPPDSPFPA